MKIAAMERIVVAAALAFQASVFILLWRQMRLGPWGWESGRNNKGPLPAWPRPVPGKLLFFP